MDIASETSQRGAAAVFLSCRRRVHVVPRYIFCTPSDALLPPCCGVTTNRRFQEALVTVMIRVSTRGTRPALASRRPTSVSCGCDTLLFCCRHVHKS